MIYIVVIEMYKDCYVKKALGWGIMIISLFMVFSCQSKLKKSFALAGDNRTEMEKVLDYYKNDPEPLKYESAKFLIENMYSQYYMYGPAVDILDSIYLSTSGVSQNLRTKYFTTASSNVNLSNFNLSFDVSVLKSEYLIKAIDEACDTWKKSAWHEKYDQSLFFEYVLPYRIGREPISDWRESVKHEFPLLEQEKVLSRRGLQLEAEDASYERCIIQEYSGASNGFATKMINKESSICFKIESERETEKRLILKYSTIAHQLTAVLCINGIVADTLHLSPTRNIESFAEKWFFHSLKLKKGENEICISGVSDTMCVDYVQLGAIENFRHNEIIDFSTNYYSIINKANNHSISINKKSYLRDNQIYLVPYSSSDTTQYIRLDYAGYPLWKIGCYKTDSLDICLGIEFGTLKTLSSGTTVTTDKYLARPFNHWLFLPLANGCFRIMNKHTGMFLDTKYDVKTCRDVLVQRNYSDSDSQEWLLNKRAEKISAEKAFGINSAQSEAMRILDMTHQFEYFIYDNPFGTKGSSLFKTKSGKCDDETCFSVFLCRFLGIPSAYDFTPHWGNRSGSHSWSVLLDEGGKTIPFYMGNSPGDTAHYFHSYIKPKVFRYRYSLNNQIVEDLKDELSVPKLFEHPHYTDVTNEYCKIVDVERQIPHRYRGKKIAYICVFDNRDWVPVHYGRVHDDKVTFTSMGSGIVYVTGFYENGEIIPFGYPFLLDNDGNVKEIIVNKRKKVKMKLLRKYPFMGAQDFFNSRMDGGQFQGSNNPDFSDVTIFHIHKGITNGNWYTVPVQENT